MNHDSVSMLRLFGHDPQGDPVLSHTIRNGGAAATLLSWGASLQDFRLAGADHPLVLGGTDMQAYLGPMQYFGAIVGPVANRIEGARMVVGDQHHMLDRNENDRTTLHSGSSGFSQRNWVFDQVERSACRMVLTHAHGLGSFPGPIRAAVTYRLDNQGALEIEITGETDSATVFSPAFHGYWNLTGSGDLSDHRLQIMADRFLPVDADQIPFGPPTAVADTPYDYRAMRPIGAKLDHNFCLPQLDGAMQLACRLEGGDLTLEVMTDQPGVQLYNGQHIDTGDSKGLTGRGYGAMTGLAIEPQFWPNTPHQPDYPSNLLMPGRLSAHRSRFVITRNS